MRKFSFFSGLALALLLLACGSDAAPPETTGDLPPATNAFGEADRLMAEEADAARVSTALMANFSAVSDAETGALNEAASRQFVELAEQLAQRFPSDTSAALPLYRAAEVVRALNDPARAAAFYQTVHANYPTFSRAPEALFMQAFTYHEDLRQLDRAETTYRKFLAKYPGHGFADDTEMLLANLHKSNEEILRELEAKNAGEQ